MVVLHQFVTEPHTCSYLPERKAKLEYTYAVELTPEEYEELMNRGHRKFGAAVFRPVCQHCRACRPIRVCVERFRPDRSQRRAWKRNQDLEVRFGMPAVDSARLELYTCYHAAQEQRRGWPEQPIDAAEYEFSFVRNPVPGVEISAWEGDALRAVLLADVTPNVVSAIYHYHDPKLPERGLGTFTILHCIELARRLGKPWVYLGFFVAGCASMTYKERFRPCEILDEGGVWREA